MKITLKRKFKGREAYVVNLVGQVGVDSVMKLYDVKRRVPFLRWYAENSRNGHPKDPFANFSGGEKQMWNKEHINTILDCVQLWGEDWVKSNFNFTHDTLYNLIRYGQKDSSGIFTHKELESMHKELERIELMVKAEHLNYVDSIKQTRQLEIDLINFAQVIAHQLATDLTPALEDIFKIKPRQLTKGEK